MDRTGGHLQIGALKNSRAGTITDRCSYKPGSQAGGSKLSNTLSVSASW